MRIAFDVDGVFTDIEKYQLTRGKKYFKNIPEDIKREYIPKLKIIPFASLGKQNGMLVGIKPEKIEIINEQTEENKNAIIGIYNKSLTKKGEYNALIGIELY